MSLSALVGAIALAACGGGEPNPADPDATGPVADAAADAAPDAVVDAPPMDADPFPDAIPYDCNMQPSFPLEVTTLTGFTDAEDFAFDADGNLVSTDSNGNLTSQPRSGPRTVIAPNVGSSTAGTAYLPNGDLAIANVGEGSVVVVSPNGAQQTILSGIAYPNGLTVGKDGMIYVSEHDAGNVRRVDPVTGDFDIIAGGLDNPNGLAFSPDFRRLYVGSFGGGTVHFIPFDATGNPLPKQPFGAMPPGVGDGLDGMGVDVCGYVYVTVFVDGEIWRFPPQGGQPEHVVTLDSFWIPNMDWGSGIGGWDTHLLYVSDREQGRVFELHLGIPGIPSVYP